MNWISPERVAAFACCAAAFLSATLAAAPAAQDAKRPDAAALLAKATAAADNVVYDFDRARTFRVVAHAQARAGDAAGARRSLAAARRAAGSDRSMPELRCTAYCEIARDQFRSGDAAAAATLDDARRAAAEVRPARARAIKYADVALARSRTGDEPGATADFRSALDAAANDPTVSQDDTFSWVARAMASAGRLAEAEAAAADIPTEWGQSRANEAVAAARARAGDTAGARTTAARIRSRSVRSAAERAIAGARARAGDIKDAAAIAAGIADAIERDGAYADIVAAQADAGDAAGAKATATAVEWRSDAGRADAFVTLAGIQARTGDLPGAKASAAIALAAAERIGPSHLAATLTVSVASALHAAGDVAGASACLARGRAFADQMAQGDPANSSVIGESFRKWRLMATIASAQVAAGDLDEAKATAAAIEEEESRAHACRAIAAAEARAGDLTALLQWIDSLPAPMARAYAYVGAAEALNTPTRIDDSVPAAGRPSDPEKN